MNNFKTVRIERQFRRFLPGGIYKMAPAMADALISKEFGFLTEDEPGSPAVVAEREALVQAAEKKKKGEAKAAEAAKKAEEKKVEKPAAAPVANEAPGPSKTQVTGPKETGKKRTRKKAAPKSKK